MPKTVKTLTILRTPSRRCSGVSTRLGTGRSMGRGSSRSSHADSRTGRPRAERTSRAEVMPSAQKCPRGTTLTVPPSQWRSLLCWPERFGAVSTGCGGSKIVPYGQNPDLNLSLTPAGSGRRAPMRQPPLLSCCVVGGSLIEACQHSLQTCLRQCLAAGLCEFHRPGPPDARDPGAIEQRLCQCGPPADRRGGTAAQWSPCTPPHGYEAASPSPR